MTTKLEKLTNDENLLIARLAELDQAQKELRAALTEHPEHNPDSVAGRIAGNSVQIETFTEKLNNVKRLRMAEEARINSPEVKRDIKQAEKIMLENGELCQAIAARLDAMQRDINEAIAKGNIAAQLLKNSGRENSAAHGGAYAELSEIGQALQALVLTRSQNGMYTKLIKAAQAAQAARDVEHARDAEQAKAQAKQKQKSMLSIFTQA